MSHLKCAVFNVSIDKIKYGCEGYLVRDMIGILLHQYLSSDHDFIIFPLHKHEHVHTQPQPDFIVTKVLGLAPDEQHNSLIVAVLGPSAIEIQDHDEWAVEQLHTRYFQIQGINIGGTAGRVYGAVCIGKTISFYIYDASKDSRVDENIEISGEPLATMAIRNRGGKVIVGPLDIVDNAEDVEDFLVYIRDNPNVDETSDRALESIYVDRAYERKLKPGLRRGFNVG